MTFYAVRGDFEEVMCKARQRIIFDHYTVVSVTPGSITLARMQFGYAIKVELVAGGARQNRGAK